MINIELFSRELSRFGRESSFVEKKGYTPDVHIEYVDDHGRLLNTKEVGISSCTQT